MAGRTPAIIQHDSAARTVRGILFQSVMFPSVTISLTFRRPFAAVYAFLCDPANLDRWTAGVVSSPIRHVADYHWQATFDGAQMELLFSPPNEFGVLDARIVGPHGVKRVYWSRLIPNGIGAELICTIIQGETETDAQFASECEWLRTDLKVLQNYIETH